MKKYLIGLLLLVSTVWATPARAFGFDWGVTAGLNLTKVNLKNDAKAVFSSDNRAGWFMGLKGNLSIGLGFGVDASLLYSQQKYNLEVAESYGALQSESKTARAISIPLNLRYNIGIGSIASVFVTTGPQFDFNIGSRNWNIFSSNYTGNDGLFKTENMTTSWNIGAGIKVMDRVEVGLGYNFGLNKVAETALSNIAGQNIKSDDLKANTFKVSLAIYL